MSTPPALPANEDQHWARPVMERQIALLGELAEDGLAIAKAIKAQILSQAEGAPVSNAGQSSEEIERLTRAWNRAARAVRLSLMLQAKLVRDIDEMKRGVARLSDAEVTARKGRVQRIINRVVDQQQAAARWRLEPLATERLDQDFCGDILARPISELVELICRDLNLNVHWPTLAREPWAQEEIDGGRPGWPLAAFLEGQEVQGPGGGAQRQPARALSP